MLAEKVLRTCLICCPRRVEESVLLAERLQREKDELQSQCTQLTAARDSLEAKLTPEAMDEQVSVELLRKGWADGVG